VRLAERDNVGLIEHSNQGADDLFDTRGFAREAPVRLRRHLGRLSTKRRLSRPSDSHHRDDSQDALRGN
jgi:hypothetical protein